MVLQNFRNLSAMGPFFTVNGDDARNHAPKMVIHLQMVMEV